MMETPTRVALGKQVALLLRRRIVSGQLAPGEHLVETLLSAEFAVSRGPIRDALRDLESEGLVESARQGVRVVGLHVADITELYSLRGQIESLALKLCIENNSAADWRAFDRPLAQLDEAAERGDAAEFAAADFEFHTLIYRLSRHRRLMSVWLQYEPTFKALLEVTNREDRNLRPVAAAHAAILRLCRDGDLAGAELELQDHLRGSSDRLRAAHARIVAASSFEAAHQ
jgi:GntR family transcriptional regulator of gluconate operon